MTLYVRKITALALCLAVQGAALTGPLVHAHPDDLATAHHAGRAIHTHWGGHAHASAPSGTPAVASEDHDRAVFLNAFLAAETAVAPSFVLVQAVFELPVPAERAPHRGIDAGRSHDPPLIGSLPSRAPPTFPA